MAITVKFRKKAGDGTNDANNADIDIDINTGQVTLAAGGNQIGPYKALVEAYEDGHEQNSTTIPISFELLPVAILPLFGDDMDSQPLNSVKWSEAGPAQINPDGAEVWIQAAGSGVPTYIKTKPAAVDSTPYGTLTFDFNGTRITADNARIEVRINSFWVILTIHTQSDSDNTLQIEHSSGDSVLLDMESFTAVNYNQGYNFNISITNGVLSYDVTMDEINHTGNINVPVSATYSLDYIQLENSSSAAGPWISFNDVLATGQ